MWKVLAVTGLVTVGLGCRAQRELASLCLEDSDCGFSGACVANSCQAADSPPDQGPSSGVLIEQFQAKAVTRDGCTADPDHSLSCADYELSFVLRCRVEKARGSL